MPDLRSPLRSAVCWPRFLAALLLCLFIWGCAPAAPAPPAPGAAIAVETRLAPTVLLVGIDGFRWDYFDRYPVPTLRRLAAEGVRARAMIPSFPTLTFPNHYTLVTGLRPENHGIVANSMYDPVFDASFSLGDREAVMDPRWWGGTPIWVTAERAGQRTAAFFWPGSEAPIQGMHPAYWTPYDDDFPGSDRVEQVLRWLQLPREQRPTFITLYFSLVDNAGHRHGPDSPQVAAAVDTADALLAELVQGLESRQLLDQLNLIIVSDHGMTATSPERVIALDDYLDLSEVRVVNWYPVLMLLPHPGQEEAIYQALKGKHPNLQVYRREEMPAEYHFQDHRRIPPVLGVADEGWVVSTRERLAREPERFSGGAHGYDHRLASMHALFVARGPAFRQGLVVEPFENVHIYSLMTAILGLTPAPNDGNLQAVEHLLREPARRTGAAGGDRQLQPGR
ncbi:MAG: ectonucleotide pyrophosphatase/phosphodiesterase [Longimicrobiaceae bacterium]